MIDDLDKAIAAGKGFKYVKNNNDNRGYPTQPVEDRVVVFGFEVMGLAH